MPSYRDNPTVELPSTNSWTVAEDNAYFIWDGDSQSFVSFSLGNTSAASDRSWQCETLAQAYAIPHSSPKPVNNDWADEVEEELFTGEPVTFFDVTMPADRSKIGAETCDTVSIAGRATTTTSEAFRADTEAKLDMPRHRSCSTIVEEDSKLEDEDEGDRREPEEEPPKGRDVSEEPPPKRAVADPLVGTGFGVDDLGYPLHACKSPTAAFLENVARDDDVSNLVIVDPETLDGGYVMVDMTGMCVTPEGVEVGKHRDLLRRWKSAMKRGFSNTPILVSSKAPSKYRISNTNYAKHKAQFHSVVCVTVMQSVETVTR
ncbi:hypothetical protein GSI_00607 [Ganoderma sinense ZZ0214-1]|uniref:Uncharacterized protein n=1 Tax=Ganoderma sinense ZZ0214-1 TaxID=1077348 RepID=A0A2G8ST12_9APHY|nr:hypothetical protein GSI_00607 [Ganoderma sinense ZZ0214-1]